MNYRTLSIWQLARQQSIAIHKMSLRLPKFELYETGSLKDEVLFKQLQKQGIELGIKLTRFIEVIEKRK